jgi:hypothetical protein
MKQSSSSKANTFSASVEITSIVWNPNVHYRVHKSPSLVSVLSQTIPAHVLPASIFDTLSKHIFQDGRDSVVGIGIRSVVRNPVGARFSIPVQTGPGAHSTSCTKGTGSFPDRERPRRSVENPPPPSAEVNHG